MSVNIPKIDNRIIEKLMAEAMNLPWLALVASGWKTIKKLTRGLANEGMYQVLEHEVTVELLDKKGKKAHVQKRQRMKYQQNNILAYQDQAWGDGEILLDYQCNPGKKVDEYRIGHKHFVLISLQSQKERGDEDEFLIEWDMKNGFLTSKEEWGSEISHSTKNITLQIIFPKSRPPLQVFIIEAIRGRTRLLPQEAIRRLPDGRWLVQWHKKKPRLYETYVLRWEW